MSATLSPSVVAALRPSAEAAPRLATSGLSSPGDVAGQFAAMLASLRDAAAGAAAVPAETMAAGASQPAGHVAAAAAPSDAEHRVGLSAVSLLMLESGGAAPAADGGDAVSARRKPAAADVSGQVVQQAVASGAPSDGRWMAMLMAADPAAEAAA